MSKPIIVAICGKSASGKDTLAKLLYDDLKRRNININLIVSDTTRNPRESETDKIDYNFLDTITFLQKAINREYLEYTKFRGWYYGTAKSSIKKDAVNIGIFNVQGLRELLDFKEDYNIAVIYLEASFKTRLRRSYEREYKWKIEFFRRAWVDHKDFKDIRKLLFKFDNILQLDEFDTLNNKLKRAEMMIERVM